MTVEAVATPASRNLTQNLSSEMISGRSQDSAFTALLQQAAQSGKASPFNALVAALDEAETSAAANASARNARLADHPQMDNATKWSTTDFAKAEPKPAATNAGQSDGPATKAAETTDQAEDAAGTARPNGTEQTSKKQTKSADAGDGDGSSTPTSTPPQSQTPPQADPASQAGAAAALSMIPNPLPKPALPAPRNSGDTATSPGGSAADGASVYPASGQTATAPNGGTPTAGALSPQTPAAPSAGAAAATTPTAAAPAATAPAATAPGATTPGTADPLASAQAAALAQQAGGGQGTVKIRVKTADSGGSAPTPAVANAAALHQVFSNEADSPAGLPAGAHPASADAASGQAGSNGSGSGTNSGTGAGDQSAQSQSPEPIAPLQPFAPGFVPGGAAPAAAADPGGETQAISALGGVAGGAGDSRPAAEPVAVVAPAAAQGGAQTTALDEPAATLPARQPVVVTPADQIKVQLARNLKEGNDTISVQLHPNDLGHVEVKLEMRDGQVKATITADRPETLQLLKNDAGSLQQSLQNAGLNADANSLNFQLRSDQQQGRQAGQDRQNAPRDNGADPGGDVVEAVGQTQAPSYRSGGDSGVDISV